MRLSSPRQALDLGIATVHQHLSVQPLMSVTRNFFVGREPVRGWGSFRTFDLDYARKTVREELKRGQSYGTFNKSEVTRDEVLDMMSGGRELEALETELGQIGQAG